MKFSEYLIIRSGKQKGHALTRVEELSLGIDTKIKGWVKRHKDVEVPYELACSFARHILNNPKTARKVKIRIKSHFFPNENVEIVKKIWNDLRLKVFERDGNICRFCGIQEDGMHIDHKLPKFLFPSLTYDLDNLQVLCKNCNSRKGHKVLAVYLSELSHKLLVE